MVVQVAVLSLVTLLSKVHYILTTLELQMAPHHILSETRTLGPRLQTWYSVSEAC